MKLSILIFVFILYKSYFHFCFISSSIYEIYMIA